MKTSELIGAQLDWAVAKCGGIDAHVDGNKLFYQKAGGRSFLVYAPSTNWVQGGPLTEREGISVVMGNDLIFPKGNERGEHTEPLYLARYSGAVPWTHGPTPLIAAMRCCVVSKLGAEVDIPEELV